jgi:hypothetical protein
MLLGLAGLSKSVDSATTKARNAKLKILRHLAHTKTLTEPWDLSGNYSVI